MNCIGKLACLMLFGTLFVSSVASATVIYSEDFENTGFQGASLNLGTADLFSERYNPTTYYLINNANGWIFTAGTYLAVEGLTNGLTNGANHDAGALLNENGGSALQVVGLINGQEYILTFNHSGDNRPNNNYVITLAIDSSFVALTNPNRSWSVTGPGIIETVLFTAGSNSASFLFGETSNTEASPIIDNILIQTREVAVVPEPSTFILLGAGLVGMAVWRKKRA